MTLAIIILVISVVSSILGFIFRKTLGAVFKLIPIAALVVVCICFVRGIPVLAKVHEYQKLCETNIEELKKDAKEYEKYVEQVKEMNEWVIEYQEKILDHPALTFCKEKIESFTQIEIK